MKLILCGVTTIQQKNKAENKSFFNSGGLRKNCYKYKCVHMF